MNQHDFTELLERELARRGIPLHFEEMGKYVEAVWPAAQWEPNAERWADRLSQAGLGSLLVSSLLPRRAKDRCRLPRRKPAAVLRET